MLAELKTKIAQIIFLIHISSTIYLLTGQRETGLKLSEQIKRDPSENIAGITYRNTFQLIGKDGHEIRRSVRMILFNQTPTRSFPTLIFVFMTLMQSTDKISENS